MMVIESWLVFNMIIKHCDWFFKILSTVLECSDLLHIVQNSFINKICGKKSHGKYTMKIYDYLEEYLYKYFSQVQFYIIPLRDHIVDK